jgi:outer membrane lipoprotein-sorting protein
MKKLLPLLCALVPLLAGADEPNEAEKLFREMEAKVTKAKAIDCTYEATAEADNKKGTMKGTLLLAEGNKVRMGIEGDLGGMKSKYTMIADGMKMKSVAEGAPAQPAQDAPKWLGDAVRSSLARAGLFFPFMTISATPPGKDFKADEHFPVSDFKLGKKEAVGKQEAQVVQYTLTMKSITDVKLDVSVWIDTKTHLPLKRTLTGSIDGNKMTVTEMYTKMELDGKVDAKQFELPKE